MINILVYFILLVYNKFFILDREVRVQVQFPTPVLTRVIMATDVKGPIIGPKRPDVEAKKDTSPRKETEKQKEAEILNV